MASKTGSSLPAELEITRSTSEVAVCCSTPSARYFRASASSRLHASSCCSKSAGRRRTSPTRALPFVPVERSLRPRVRFLAPLRDKVTSGCTSINPGTGHRHLKHTTAGWIGHLRQWPQTERGPVKSAGALFSAQRPSVRVERDVSERQTHTLGETARLSGSPSASKVSCVS